MNYMALHLPYIRKSEKFWKGVILMIVNRRPYPFTRLSSSMIRESNKFQLNYFIALDFIIWILRTLFQFVYKQSSCARWPFSLTCNRPRTCEWGHSNTCPIFFLIFGSKFWKSYNGRHVFLLIPNQPTWLRVKLFCASSLLDSGEPASVEYNSTSSLFVRLDFHLSE